MKNKIYTIVLILLITALCLSLYACASGGDISDDVSDTLDQPILIKGDFKPEEEKIITYEKALEQYGDSTTASFHSSRAREAYLVPRPDMEIEKIRISIPKRGILIPDAPDSGFAENAEIYQIYYGYYSDGLWHDYPAENYELKTLHDPNDSGFSDGLEALCGHHAVKIGPYVLLAFIDVFDNAIVEDVLDSEVLTLSSDKITSETPYLLLENVFEGNDEHITFEYRNGAFLLLKYDELTTGYFVIIREYEPIFEAYSETIYTYDDIMEALNRK